MLSAALALGAAIFYGAADFLGGLGSRRLSVLAVVAGVQLIGLLALCAALPWLHAEFTRKALIFGIAAGACSSAGLALLYYALAIGRMGVVSPLTAVIAAVVPVAAGFIRGERLSAAQIAGIALALVAVVLVSAQGEGDRRKGTAGVREAAVSGILLGSVYVLLAAAGASAGMSTLLVARAAATVLLVPAAWYFRRASDRFSLRVVQMIVCAGILDGAANAMYVSAAYAGAISTAAVLTSLYPGSTALLARIFLKERLAPLQIVGAITAIGSVALIAS